MLAPDDDEAPETDVADEAPSDLADGVAAALAGIDAEEAAVLASLADEDAESDEAGRQRRQNVRIDVQVPLRLVAAGRAVPCRTRDLSATGVGFSTRVPIENGQRIEVEIDFDGWTLRKPCVVRFTRPIIAGTQVGCQFEELQQGERERLVKLVFDMQRARLQQS